MTVFREHVEEKVWVADEAACDDVVTEAMVEAGAIKYLEIKGLPPSATMALAKSRHIAREIIEAALKARNNS